MALIVSVLALAATAWIVKTVSDRDEDSSLPTRAKVQIKPPATAVNIARGKTVGQ